MNSTQRTSKITTRLAPRQSRSTRLALRLALPFLWLSTIGIAFASGVGDRLETLGNNASVFRLHLLDESGALAPANATTAASLMLEVSLSNGESKWLIVPGTEDAAVEKAPGLTFSQTTNTLLVVWEDQRSVLHSSIRISGYREGEGFFDLVDLVGNPFYSKLRPAVLETTDSASWVETQSGEAGEPAVISHRNVAQRVLHTVWREEQGHLFYSALAEGSNGAMAAIQPIDLSEHLPELSANWETGIDGTLTLVRGSDSRTVLMHFVDPVRRTLESVEISSLPIEIAVLADTGFDTVASSEGSNGDLVSISEEARNEIVFIGRRMVSEATTDVLSRAAADTVLAAREPFERGGLVGVAQEARNEIVFIGRSLRTSRASELGEDALLLQMALSNPSDLGTDHASTGRLTREPTVHLVVDHLSSRSLPEEAPEDASVLASSDGERVLLYWKDSEEGAVSYCESTTEGWTEIQQLHKDRVGSLGAAEQLLRSRFSSAR